jgi:hypothetical protein
MVSPELAPVGWGENPTGVPSRGNGGVAPHPTGLEMTFADLESEGPFRLKDEEYEIPKAA